MGEVYHRGISDSKWQHTHLDSCSQSYPAMSPDYVTSEPCIRQAVNTREKGMQPWTASEWNYRCLHGQCIIHCDCMALTCFSSHLLWGSACTQGQQSLIKHDPVYSKNWGANPVLKWVLTITEQRRDLTSSAGSRQKSHPYQGDKGQHALRKMRLASIRKPILEPKYWVHTVYTEMFPLKNTTSKPKYITISPKFIETEKVKKKKKRNRESTPN